jgi:hypothetical protein
MPSKSTPNLAAWINSKLQNFNQDDGDGDDDGENPLLSRQTRCQALSLREIIRGRRKLLSMDPAHIQCPFHL